MWFLGELPQNCKEVKKLNSASVDGEYFLAVRGKPLKVSAELLLSHCSQNVFVVISSLLLSTSVRSFLVYLTGILCRDEF